MGLNFKCTHRMKNSLQLTFFFLLLAWNYSNAQSLDEIVEDYQNYQDESSKIEKSAWPDISDANLHKKQIQYQTWVDQLKEIDKASLSMEDQITLDLLLLICKDVVDNIELKSHYIPLNAEGGFIVGMMYANRGLNLKNEKSWSNYKAKLAATPAYINQQIQNMRLGLENGITMPQLVVKNCLAVLDNMLSRKTLFLLNGLPSYEGIDTLAIQSSFKTLQGFLEEDYLPVAREKVGVSNNANGKAFYEQRVRFFTTKEMTPQEVFDTGMSEVKRIRGEMEEIIKELAFEGSYADFLEFLRTDPQFYVSEGDELLRHAAWLTTRAQGILPKYFTQLPTLPLTVNPVPAAIAPTYTTGRYSGGSFFGRKAGEYWVNTYNLPARPLYVLPALTLHEGVPGHHLQISLAQELKDLPEFRKRQYLSAYGEGWGLYCEYLGKEAGMYQTLYEDFGRLTYEMWRACRLVVDPGMHYFDWTRQEALNFMAQNTALSMHEVTTEIDRYIGWPGQAVSYKIGEITIRELRKKAEESLGDKFDVRDFHDTILENGSVPLFTLEDIVDRWIETQLKE